MVTKEDPSYWIFGVWGCSDSMRTRGNTVSLCQDRLS